MQINELTSELAAMFPEFSKEAEGNYRRILKEGPELREALTRTLAGWKKSRAPLPADIAAHYRKPEIIARPKRTWADVYERAGQLHWEYQRKLEEHWRKKFGTNDPDVEYRQGPVTIMIFAPSNEWIYNLSDVLRERLRRYLIEKVFDDWGAGDVEKLKRAHDDLTVTQADIDIAVGRYEGQARIASTRAGTFRRLAA